MKGAEATAGYANKTVESFHKMLFREKKVKEIKAFLEKSGADCSVNSTRSDGLSALHIAASKGQAKMVRFLIEQGAAVDARESHGVTPLNLACQQGKPDIVSLLLQAGADVQSCRNDGVSCLYIAAQEGHSKVVGLLLAAKAHPSEPKRPNGATALYVAAQKGKGKVVSELLAHRQAGLDIDAMVEGVTPLEAAIVSGQEKVVKLLVEAGARVRERESGGAAPNSVAPRPSSHSQTVARELGKVLSAVAPHMSTLDDDKHTQPTSPPSQTLLLAKPSSSTHKMKKKELEGLPKAELVALVKDLYKSIAKADKHAHIALLEAQADLAASNKEAEVWKRAFLILQETTRPEPGAGGVDFKDLRDSKKTNKNEKKE